MKVRMPEIMVCHKCLFQSFFLWKLVMKALGTQAKKIIELFQSFFLWKLVMKNIFDLLSIDALPVSILLPLETGHEGIWP